MRKFIRRISGASLLLVIIAATPPTAVAAGGDDNPNIVLILMDNFGWGEVWVMLPFSIIRAPMAAVKCAAHRRPTSTALPLKECG